MNAVQIMELVRKYVSPIRQRIALMVGRGVVKVVYDGTVSSLQAVQVTLLAEEVRDKVERLQNYGFTSNPKAGAECVVVFPAGDRGHGVIIAVDDRRYRVTGLAPGESAHYSDEGDFAAFKRGREYHVRSNKFQFQGATDELMDLIAQLTEKVSTLADTLSSDTTNTMLGPMKLNHFSAYATLKTQVDAIKTKLEGITV